MGIPLIDPYPVPTELPVNKVPWTVDPDRAALLVHDLQRYFLDPFPAGTSPRTELLANVGTLRELAHRHGMPVFYSVQPGGMSDAVRGLVKDFWGPGMSREPGQRGLVDELPPVRADQLITKTRYSAFHATPLLERLRRAGRDQLVICGVYAHLGCLLTAFDAFANGIQPFLVADAVADFSADRHRLALEYTATGCGVVLNTADVFSWTALTTIPVGKRKMPARPVS